MAGVEKGGRRINRRREVGERIYKEKGEGERREKWVGGGKGGSSG